jgi:hypothetical protein
MSIKKAQHDIAITKVRLKAYARRKGICENFGDKDIRKLNDKYPPHIGIEDEAEIMKALTEFREWCYSFDLNNS